jgi:CheY-like chemotaxis protein
MAKVILIVEDEPSNLKLVQDLLQLSGYETIGATDGKQGIELARTMKPDLILMDIMMPKMDGYTACNAIKKNKETQGIPVVMLTAMGYELNKELARKLGAAGYLTKPFTRQRLLEVVSKFLSTS